MPSRGWWKQQPFLWVKWDELEFVRWKWNLRQSLWASAVRDLMTCSCELSAKPSCDTCLLSACDKSLHPNRCIHSLKAGEVWKGLRRVWVVLWHWKANFALLPWRGIWWGGFIQDTEIDYNGFTKHHSKKWVMMILIRQAHTQTKVSRWLASR